MDQLKNKSRKWKLMRYIFSWVPQQVIIYTSSRACAAHSNVNLFYILYFIVLRCIEMNSTEFMVRASVN